MKPKMSKAFLIENFVKMKSAAKEGLFEKNIKGFFSYRPVITFRYGKTQ